MASLYVQVQNVHSSDITKETDKRKGLRTRKGLATRSTTPERGKRGTGGGMEKERERQMMLE